ncbi:hypothetical protein D3C73_982720 [compost metagenome]
MAARSTPVRVLIMGRAILVTNVHFSAKMPKLVNWWAKHFPDLAPIAVVLPLRIEPILHRRRHMFARA